VGGRAAPSCCASARTPVDCDLVAKIWMSRPAEVGYVYPPGRPRSRAIDSGSSRSPRQPLRSMAGAGGLAITFTCVPRGSGVRHRLSDRDGDGVLGRRRAGRIQRPGKDATSTPAQVGCTARGLLHRADGESGNEPVEE